MGGGKHYNFIKLITLLIGISFLFPTNANHALAETPESILRFDALMSVEATGKINIKEEIVYDFSDSEERHGIFRNIPKTYQSGKERYKLPIENISVVDGVGEEVPFTVSQRRAEYEIKIGDPNQEVSGVHEYVLSYDVSGIVTPHDTFDEIYWNVTGNGWDVAIASASASILLPKEIDDGQLKVHCYAGRVGSKGACDNATTSIEAGRTKITYTETNLSSNQGLTVAVGFPKGVVLNTEREQAGFSSSTILKIVIAGVVSLVGFVWWAISHWWKHGRDPKGRGVIVRQYEPPANMMPAEVGFIVDERIDNRDITAELVYLAERGFMHILATPKAGFLAYGYNYYLLKLKEADDSLRVYQRNIFSALFSGSNPLSHKKVEKLKKSIKSNKKIVTDKDVLVEMVSQSTSVVSISELSKHSGSSSFYQKLQRSKGDLAQQMVDSGFLAESPSRVALRYSLLIFAGVALIIFSIHLFSGIYATLLALGIVFGAVLVIFGLILSKTMVVKTSEGVAAREHALGLKEYLSIAEKDRLEFHFNPRNNPQLFEQLLPFAIALGVEKLWARELDDIQINPDWYSDAGAQSFTVSSFNSSFSGFNTATAASYSASSSASSGGGFSGGGAGGGGGGSW